LNDPNLGRDIDLFIGPLEGVIDVVSGMRSLLVEFLLRVEALLAQSIHLTSTVEALLLLVLSLLNALRVHLGFDLRVHVRIKRVVSTFLRLLLRLLAPLFITAFLLQQAPCASEAMALAFSLLQTLALSLGLILAFAFAVHSHRWTLSQRRRWRSSSRSAPCSHGLLVANVRSLSSFFSFATLPPTPASALYPRRGGAPARVVDASGRALPARVP